MWFLIFLFAFGVPSTWSLNFQYSNNFDDNNIDMKPNDDYNDDENIENNFLNHYSNNDLAEDTRLDRNLGDYWQCNSNRNRKVVTLDAIYDDSYEYEPPKVVNTTCSIERKIDPFSMPPQHNRELCYVAGGCDTKYGTQMVLRRLKSHRHINCWEKHHVTLAVGCYCNVAFNSM